MDWEKAINLYLTTLQQQFIKMKTNFISGAFIIKDSKFLFGKRSDVKSWYPGVWDLIGGHSFAGEDPLNTLKRELHEEIGITNINAQLITTLHILEEGSKENIAYHIYIVTGWKGKPVNCCNEHSEIRWFDRSELNAISLAAPEYLNLIDDLIKEQKIHKQIAIKQKTMVYEKGNYCNISIVAPNTARLHLSKISSKLILKWEC